MKKWAKENAPISGIDNSQTVMKFQLKKFPCPLLSDMGSMLSSCDKEKCIVVQIFIFQHFGEFLGHRKQKNNESEGPCMMESFSFFPLFILQTIIKQKEGLVCRNNGLNMNLIGNSSVWFELTNNLYRRQSLKYYLIWNSNHDLFIYLFL